jgi:acyl-CoA reductase-like NAD-dependent aldehyde dehydrogenase
MLSIINPSTGEEFKKIEIETKEVAFEKLKLAQKAFVKAGFSKDARVQVLEKFMSLMEKHKEDIIQNAIAEGGKPFSDTVVEFNRAVEGVKMTLHELLYWKGEEVTMGLSASSSGKKAWIQKASIGVVFAISAFNHPINLIVHQVIPALAVGCPVVIKPALKTPLSCLKLVELLHEAGCPKDYVQALICADEVTAELAADERVAFLSFIGSSKVGWELKRNAPKEARVVLEHGGVAPMVVDQGAWTDEVMQKVLKSAYYHAGQVCVSLQKLYVHQNDFESVVQKLKAAIKTLKVGDAARKETEVGPIITSDAKDRILSVLESAKNEGVEVVGGEALDGQFIAPTIVINPPKDHALSSDEIFGPVLCIYPYDQVDAVIEECNALPFAFQSSFISNDNKAIQNFIAKMEASTVLINEHPAFRADWMPFGGYKSSGFGLGGMKKTMEDCTREKLVIEAL